MGYLNRENNYGDDYFDPFEPTAKPEVKPSTEALKRKEASYTRLISQHERHNEKRAETLSKYREELAKTKAALKEADTFALREKLGALRPLTAVRFTTNTGFTYVALKAGDVWYLTQNGHGPSRKPALDTRQLAELIGTSSVSMGSGWREL